MIKIGKLELQNNLLLAPIAGYTDSPFRKIARKYGCGLTVTELISSEGIIRNNDKTLELLKFHNSERPLGIQIFGSSPKVMGEAAGMMEERRPDFIDINLGCPSAKVCKNGTGSGAALLLDPFRVEAIAASVVSSTSLPVSAKIRIGWDNTRKNYLDVIKALEAAGISFITVHGRTKSQKYKGTADWDIIKEINDVSNVDIVGNGDILSYEHAMDRLKFSGCPAVMIGRSALGNPWIFSHITPNIIEKIEQIKEHLKLMIDFYGERGLILMRKHLVKYISGIRNASKVRKRLTMSDNAEEVNEILDLLQNL